MKYTKLLLVISIIFILFSLISCDDEKEPLNENLLLLHSMKITDIESQHDLIGKVKFVQIKESHMTRASVPDKNFKYSMKDTVNLSQDTYESYNYGGNLLESYDVVDNLRMRYSYDMLGNLISITSGSDSVLFIYDNNKNQIAGKSSTNKATGIYDSYNNLLLYKEFSKCNELKGILLFAYDKKGNKVRSYLYDKESKLFQYTYFQYDSCNNLLFSKCFNKDGKIKSKTKFTYNKYNSKLSYAIYDDCDEKECGSENIIESGSYKYTDYDSVGNWLTRTKLITQAEPHLFYAIRVINYFKNDSQIKDSHKQQIAKIKSPK